MTAEEKALELYDKFDLNGSCQKCEEDDNETYMCPNMIKRATLICVEELIQTDYHNDKVWYWEEVKKEIEKI